MLRSTTRLDAGINISEGTWGGHLIERCDVFDTVLETSDHGSFNSWGRDRYWRSDASKISQAAVDKDPKLPFLDAMKTTIIRDSRWRCDHGWDIDLDDGSTNYDIYNNVLLNRGLKLREGFRRHAYNNVMPVGWFHPHVWFQSSNDRVYSNIFSKRHAPARMTKPYTDGETMVDRNLFTTDDPKILSFSARLGWDENSILGDPMYVDPENGDFRVKDGSPALKIGFKNFPMDQFGVKKPSLKAIARTPEIPDLDVNKDVKQRRAPPLEAERFVVWQGAQLKDLGAEDFSAYGSNKDDGGVAIVKVFKDSAASAGLREGDLIQAVNGKLVANIKQLLTAVRSPGKTPIELTVLRDQKPVKISLQPTTEVVTELSKTADGFTNLSPPAKSKFKLTTNNETSKEPLSSLTDGKLATNFGPVFANGIVDGMYKMDLGAVKPVSAIRSWSFQQKGSRGVQKLTIFASDSDKDPGWNPKKYTPVGTIETDAAKKGFTAASLQSTNGKAIGNYRWIIWAVSPISEARGGENTTFQELGVSIPND